MSAFHEKLRAPPGLELQAEVVGSGFPQFPMFGLLPFVVSRSKPRKHGIYVAPPRAALACRRTEREEVADMGGLAHSRGRSRGPRPVILAALVIAFLTGGVPQGLANCGLNPTIWWIQCPPGTPGEICFLELWQCSTEGNYTCAIWSLPTLCPCNQQAGLFFGSNVEGLCNTSSRADTKSRPIVSQLFLPGSAGLWISVAVRIGAPGHAGPACKMASRASGMTPTAKGKAAVSGGTR